MAPLVFDEANRRRAATRRLLYPQAPLIQVIAVLIAVNGAGVADAESGGEMQWRSNMKLCTALHQESERLACYDKLASALDSGDALTQVAPTPQNMFGVQGQLARQSVASKADGREELRTVSARVTALRSIAGGTLLIDTDQGQTWRQEEGGELLLAVGDTVTISRAAMSSFRLTTPTGRFCRVKRVK